MRRFIRSLQIAFMATLRTCTLHPLDNAYEQIILPHKKCVVLGRNPFTKITDKRCSRSQVQVEADVDNTIVKVSHVGGNKCGVNGLAMEKNSSITLHHNDIIELVLDYFKYEIIFDPPPNEGNDKKRPLTDSDEQIAKRLCADNGEKLDVKDASAKANIMTVVQQSTGWESIDGGLLLKYTSPDCKAESKIAAFDLDGTIITTKSGKVFPVNNDDWKIAFPVIPGKLNSLQKSGYKIVILTNQAGISKGKVNVKDFKRKVKGIISKLDVPVQVYISTGKGKYRKPAPGMWNTLLECNEGVAVDVKESFYCGDAAGRPDKWAPFKKKDFSSADRLMAINLGLTFHTPEEYFLNHKVAPYNLPEFIPSDLQDNGCLTDPKDAKISSKNQEVIVLIGCPGSGKSHFAKMHLKTKGYLHVNRDTLGSWQKCVSELEKALSMGKSVVVDNTNPDKESRKRFVAVAQRNNVPCRCFVLNTSLQHAKHNNRFRELTDHTHQEITDMVINSYKKKFEAPSTDEGFSEIVKVNCVPKFEDDNQRELYKMFLLEK